MTTFRPAIVHADLGPEFFDPVEAAAFPAAAIRHRNQRWADRIGLGDLSDKQWIDHFARFAPLAGSFTQPLALRYHGHQFRAYNPDLGDGRGFLFAQGYDDRGRLLDLATKGSGQTPWSRGGDGRLTLKGGMREVLATEMLEALGVNTSKSFSLIETGEELYRHDEPSPARSSVLVRLSHSHIRIGTFQRLAYFEKEQELARLVDHTIRHYFADLWTEAAPDRAVALLEAVSRRVARLGAEWIGAGFVHGVLNTDNINLTGESFDYGPWRFLPHYDPGFTAAYFDESGLYAFGRQPDALAWNLTRLAECLVPLAPVERLEPALNVFWPVFREQLTAVMLGRLGLAPQGMDADAEMVTAIFGFLADSKAPYEQFFFDWRGGALSAGRAAKSPEAERYMVPAFEALANRMEAYAPSASVNLDHPYFARQRPRTMLIDEVEALWSPIAEADDWSAFGAALEEISQMRQAYEGDRAEPV